MGGFSFFLGVLVALLFLGAHCSRGVGFYNSYASVIGSYLNVHVWHRHSAWELQYMAEVFGVPLHIVSDSLPTIGGVVVGVALQAYGRPAAAAAAGQWLPHPRALAGARGGGFFAVQ